MSSAKSDRFLFSGYTFQQEQEFKAVRAKIQVERIAPSHNYKAGPRQPCMQKSEFLRNSLPKALSEKIGEETTARKCIQNGYRSRRMNNIRKCPACGSSRIFFRTGAVDGMRGIKCRVCKVISPLPPRATFINP